MEIFIIVLAILASGALWGARKLHNFHDWARGPVGGPSGDPRELEELEYIARHREGLDDDAS